MRAIITPHKLSGNISIISSKSYTHRAIIAASLASGISKIDNVYFSNDILATISICKKMGAKIDRIGDSLLIEGVSTFNKVDMYDASDSGSTLRFLLPVLLIKENEFTITGHNNLVNRPLDVYYDLFEQIGIEYHHQESNLPLSIKGRLKPGEYVIKDLNSSQFITGLLFALPLLEADSKIIVEGKIESISYIKLSIHILSLFGIKIEEFENGFYIPGNQEYKATNIISEGDYSQAAFFLVANLMGNNINVFNLNPDSLQADKKIMDIIQSFSSENCVVDLADCPDLGPILFTLASTLDKETRFINTKRLKIKESDRIKDLEEELSKIGARFSVYPNEVLIKGTLNRKGDYVFDTHKDHRIIMSLAILSTVLEGQVVINGIEEVSKSYPTFFEDFKKLGGIVDEIN